MKKTILIYILTIMSPIVAMSQNVIKYNDNISLTASQPYGYGYITDRETLPLDSAKKVFAQALLLKDKESVKYGDMIITKCLWSDKFLINFIDPKHFIPGGEIAKNLRKEMFDIIK
jgi:hypothetical protein